MHAFIPSNFTNKGDNQHKKSSYFSSNIMMNSTFELELNFKFCPAPAPSLDLASAQKKRRTLPVSEVAWVPHFCNKSPTPKNRFCWDFVVGFVRWMLGRAQNRAHYEAQSKSVKLKEHCLRFVHGWLFSMISVAATQSDGYSLFSLITRHAH